MTAFLINEQNMQQSKRFRDTLYIYVWSLKPNFYKLSSKNYLQGANYETHCPDGFDIPDSLFGFERL